MDDTQNQQPTDQPAAPRAPADTMSSMNDVAGMTPPPAPVMPDTAAPAMPADNPMPADSASSQQANPADAEQAGDDYSYAEDVLNEILDSLDRIEAKLDAMEKKG